MTKTVQITDAAEIKAVTVECAKCGAAFTVPVGKHRTPAECHHCEAALDAAAVDELIAALRHVQRADGGSIRIRFETTPE